MLWSFERFFWGRGRCGHYHSHGVFSCFFPTFTLNTLGTHLGYDSSVFFFLRSSLRPFAERRFDRWNGVLTFENSSAQQNPLPERWLALAIVEFCGKLQDHARPCETITQNGQSCFPEKSVFERRAYFSYMSMSLGKLQLASLRQSHLHVTSTPMELLFGFWEDAWMHQSIWELEGLDSKLWFWLSGKYDRVQKRRKKSSNWLLHHSKSILQLCTLFCCTEKWLLKQHHNECCNTANQWYAIYRML